MKRLIGLLGADRRALDYMIEDATYATSAANLGEGRICEELTFNIWKSKEWPAYALAYLALLTAVAWKNDSFEPERVKDWVRLFLSTGNTVRFGFGPYTD